MYLPGMMDFGQLSEKYEDNFANPEYYKNAKPMNKRAKTAQQKINEDPEKIAAKVEEMKEGGRIEIEGSPDEMLKQLESFHNGKKKDGSIKLTHKILVSYVTKDNLYRCGGFIRSINDQYKYIAVLVPDKNISFSVQLANVKALYVQKRHQNKSRNKSKSNAKRILRK